MTSPEGNEGATKRTPLVTESANYEQSLRIFGKVQPFPALPGHRDRNVSVRLFPKANSF